MLSSEQPLTAEPLNQQFDAGMPKPYSRILSIGDDSMLLKTRSMVLSQAGYRVHSCTSEEVLRILSLAKFDIALVCRSVGYHRQMALAREIHAQQLDIKMICLSPENGEAVLAYDFAIDTWMGAAAFLRSLAEAAAQCTSWQHATTRAH